MAKKTPTQKFINEAKDVGGKTVNEITGLSKKYTFTVFLCVVLLLSFAFSFALYGQGWDILAIAAGTITALSLTTKVSDLFDRVNDFLLNQESGALYIFGGCTLLVAIFLHPILFFILGLSAGLGLRNFTSIK